MSQRIGGRRNGRCTRPDSENQHQQADDDDQADEKDDAGGLAEKLEHGNARVWIRDRPYAAEIPCAVNEGAVQNPAYAMRVSRRRGVEDVGAQRKCAARVASAAGNRAC